MQDLISVVVPIYNTGAYLQRCVDSILAQDYPNIEIILVDDGSNDNFTSALCDSLEENYENVVAYHKPNGGSASARNFGINQSHGKYIGFVDSDDTIEPNMYSMLYNDLINHDVKVSMCEMDVESNGRVFDCISKVPTRVYDRLLFMHYFMLNKFHSACTCLYTKSLFDKVQFPVNEVNEDYMLNYWIYNKLNKVYVNDTVLYHYIRRDNSNTGSPVTLKYLDWIKHTSLILDEMKREKILIQEAEFQYLYSNLVLANKSLLTLTSHKSEEASQLYSITTSNLHNNRDMLLRNHYFSKRDYICGLIMVYCPHIYKTLIIEILRMKKYILCKKG